MRQWCPAVLAVLVVASWVPAAATAEAGVVSREQVMKALPGLEALARRVVASGGVPGMAIAVIHRDQVIYMQGFGVRQAGQAARVDPDTVFQLASCSKPISATVVATLVSDGTVRWDSRIRDLDPGFRLHDDYPSAEVTLADLFAHRSGLWGGAGDELEQLGFTRPEILARLHVLAPSSSFRSRFDYSNFGLTEAGVAAARMTGKDWEDVARERLFEPLGMTATSARHADFLRRPNRAALHVRLDGRWQPKLTRNPDAQSPAGGVSASVRDLTRWMRLELGGGVIDGRRLIRAEALDATHAPAIPRAANPVTGQPSFYGLGWALEASPEGTHWTHAGAFSVGARTGVDLLAPAQLGIAVLTNAFPNGVPEGIAATFYDLVFRGKPSRDWVAAYNGAFDQAYGPPAVAAGSAPFARPPASPAPALPLARYTGAFANHYLGRAEVTEVGQALHLKLGDRTFPLRHFDRDLFVMVPFAETPTWPYAVRFTMGPDQRAAQVTVEAFNDVGQGTLTRLAP